MRTPHALLFAAVLLAAAPATAQYYPYPPPPPPPGGPPPPPPVGPPAPRRSPTFVRPEPAPINTARLSVGFAFSNDAFDCWYYGPAYGYGYACGYGYGFAYPNVNAEVDLGLSHYLALTVGGNVFWGTSNGLSDVIWEPHVDLLLRSNPYTDVRGRLRIGIGVYAARSSIHGVAGSSASDTGAALRLGAGVSFFSRSRVGLGLDGIFEAGSLGGYYVSTFQLLMGPEIHF